MGKLNLQIQNSGRTEIPQKFIDELIANKYFKIFIPEVLNGLELSLCQAIPVLIETAKINPSLGWLHNLGAGANYFCGFFDEEVANSIFSDEKVITSGSGTPSGVFLEKNDDFEISGKWGKCSGATFATHLTCVAKNYDNKDEEKTFILPANDVEIVNDWSNFGLKASASHSFELRNFLVAKKLEFEINKVKSFSYYSIYNVPFELFARICLSATLEGIVLKFVEDIKSEVRKPSSVLLKILEDLKQTINRLNNKRFETAKEIDLFYSKVNSKEVNHPKVKELALLHKACYDLVVQAYFNAGLRITEEESPLNWTFRDVMTAVQHYMIRG